MFRPAKMHKLGIITLEDYSKPLLNALHEEGVVQIDDISEQIKKDIEWQQIIEPSQVGPHTSEINSILMRIANIIDFWKIVIIKKSSIMELLKGFVNPEVPAKKEVDKLNIEELTSKTEELLQNVEPNTKNIQKRLDDIELEKSVLEIAQKSAENLKFLDIDISMLNDTDHTNIIVGKVNLETYDSFKDELESITPELFILEGESQDKKETTKTIIIISLKTHLEELKKVLRKFEFDKFDIKNLSGKPKEALKNVKNEIKSLEKEKEQLIDDIIDLSNKWGDELLIFKELLNIELEKNEIYSSFGKTEKTLMLEAWVPKKDQEKAIEIIKKSTEDHVIVEVENPQEDNAPIKYNNPGFAKPFEFFTTMYSPPNYKEIDPTIFFAIIFPFFFGFCLTDGFYGIIDAVVGLILYRGLGKTNEFMKYFGMVLIACGVWALILGLVTNGFIGDLIPRYLGVQIPFVIPSVDAFVHPENLLIIAIACGVLYTFFGLCVGAYNNYKNGKKAEALGDHICWILLFIGVGLLAVSYLYNIGSIYIGIAVIIISLAILLYYNGAFGIMDVMGQMGNVLSYSRLLALCLSTGGMAMAVNIVAGIVGPIAIIGPILFVIVLIGGHTINCMIQSLGAFIHSMRLHYVEFYSQFYQGQGIKYKPFSVERDITKIKK
jgi:V/A-type H+-transporting ATPase subunit I